MKKFGKIASLSLSAIMAVTALAGCAGKKSGDSSQTPGQSVSGNTLPLVDKPTTVTIWMQNPQSSTVKNYGDMLVWQEIQKRTGVTVQFKHPANNDNAAVTEAFNLMIASNDLPDIIYYNWGSTLSKFLDDKVVIKLNDLIDKNAPDLKKRVISVPEVKQQLELDDGTIAMFPQVDLDLSRNIYRGFLMRQDWLDKLNLKAPTTIDEWYTVLKAFKTKDPNGNGKADEIPLIDQKGAGLKYLAGAFGLRAGFAPDAKTGKIVFGPMQPGYKDYLATMAKWYKEGLLDSEYGTTDSKVQDSKVLGNTAGVVWGTTGNLTNYLGLGKKNDANFNMVGVQYPVGPTGKPLTTWDQTTQHISGNGGAITTQCKDPVLVTKLINYLYSAEGDAFINWGIEGKSYTVENGQKKYTDEIMKSPDGKNPATAILKYTNVSNGFMKVYDMNASKGLAVNSPQQPTDASNLWAKADNSILMPIVTPTGEESQRLTSIMSEVNTYTETMFNKFIMGREPIDNFDQYVSQLKKLGIEDAVKIEQSAYDRYKARK